MSKRETNRKDVRYSEQNRLTVATSVAGERKCEYRSIVREHSLFFFPFSSILVHVISLSVSGRTHREKEEEKSMDKNGKYERKGRNKINIDLSLFNHDK
jgi:acyl-CoA synthetase (NDP forming)